MIPRRRSSVLADCHGKRPSGLHLAVPRSALGLAVIAVIVAVGLVGAVGAIGTAGGTIPDGIAEHGENATDDERPAIVNGSKVDDTTVELHVVDNHDVDEESIGMDDFVLRQGSLRALGVSEQGSNATVTLRLAGPIGVDTLTVALTDNATISDTNGNTIVPNGPSGSTDITGMDGVSPRVERFSVSNATGQPGRIVVGSNERLGDINVDIDGPTTDHLGFDDFSYDDSAAVYEATYRPSADGKYTVTLRNISDRSGNTEVSLRSESLLADLSPPDTVAGIDFSRSKNLSIAFDAGRSSDPSGIRQFVWEFDDGTTATGERVRHEFLPGKRTVTLRAIDRYGNAGIDTITLNLTADVGNVTAVNESELRDRLLNAERTVTIDRQAGATSSDALVSVDRATAGTPIHIGTDGRAIATHGDVTLAALNVTLAVDRSFDLGVSATDPALLTDAPTNTTALGAFTIIHAISDDDIENVVFEFTVATDRLADGSVGTVSLARYNGSWNRLPTERIERPTGSNDSTLAVGSMNASETENATFFRARSPGFSRFAVLANISGETSDDTTASNESSSSGDSNESDGSETEGDQTANESERTTTPEPTATPTATSDEKAGAFAVTAATLNRTQVDPGGAVRVNVTVASSGDGGTYVAGLSVNGTVVETRAIPVPAGENRTVGIEYVTDTNTTGTVPVAVNGTAAGDLTIGGGGLLSTILGIFKPLALFVILPVVAAYGVLKGIAVYLGY